MEKHEMIEDFTERYNQIFQAMVWKTVDEVDEEEIWDLFCQKQDQYGTYNLNMMNYEDVEYFHKLDDGDIEETLEQINNELYTNIKKLERWQERLEKIMEFGDIPSFSTRIEHGKLYVCRNNGAFHTGDCSNIGGYATFVDEFSPDDDSEYRMMNLLATFEDD